MAHISYVVLPTGRTSKIMAVNYLKNCQYYISDFSLVASCWSKNVGYNSSFGMVKTYTSTSPEMAHFQRCGDLEVNYNTGILSIAVPLVNIRLKDLD